MSLRINDAQVAALGAAGCPVQRVPGHLGIALVDEDGDPVPREPFRVELPDGTSVRGTTDRSGQAVLEAVPCGTCTVTFPEAQLVQSCAVGATHTFRRRGKPAVARIRLVDRQGAPRPNLPYALLVDDLVKRGETDRDGFLTEKVPPRAQTAWLTLTDGESREEVDIALGAVREASDAGTYATLASRWETRRVVALGGREPVQRYLRTRRLPGLTLDPAGNVTFESRAQRVRYEVTFSDQTNDFARTLQTEDLLAVDARHGEPGDRWSEGVRCRAVVLLGGAGFGRERRALRRRWRRTAEGNDAYLLDRRGTADVVAYWLHRLFTYPHTSAGLPWRSALEYAKRLTNRDLLAHGETCQIVTS